MSEHLRIWRYRIDPARREEFVHAYSSDGAWTQLFQRGNGYRGSTLWQDSLDADIYYTQDCWANEDDFKSFMASWKTAYEKMDRQLEGLTIEETFVCAMNRARDK